MNYKFKDLQFKAIQFVSHIFCVLPIKKGQCFFMSHRGASQYSDSPMYISEYLSDKYDGMFKIYWMVNDLDKFSYLREKGVKLVKYNSLKSFILMNTSQICVTNCGFNSVLIKRRDQLRINTLHGGGAYKSNTVNRKNNANNEDLVKYQSDRSNIYNLMLSGCKLSTSANIRNDFCYQGKVLEAGMPRNDVFFKDNHDLVQKVKSFYDCDNYKILLWAPTWRDDNDDKNIRVNFSKLKNVLDEKFGGKWKILLRLHHLSNIDLSDVEEQFGSAVINTTSYPNVQELLLAADILVTDYSSLLWDFALQEKPIVLYTPDLESYGNERGFNIPVSDWGLPYATNQNELFEIFSQYSAEEFKKFTKDHLKIFGSYETGKATQKVCEYIYDFVNTSKEC